MIYFFMYHSIQESLLVVASDLPARMGLFLQEQLRSHVSHMLYT